MQSIDILLVEDNDGGIMLTAEALQVCNKGNRIFAVKDGVEGLNYLLKSNQIEQAVSPHFIFLDINLQKLLSHEVVKQIRSQEDLKNIPGIMWSLSSAYQDISESTTHASNAKPIDVTKFLRRILSEKDQATAQDEVINS